MPSLFSFRRTKAVADKELTQLRRDHLTLGMIVAIPLVQLILFGFAINTNPKHLPTTVLMRDYSPYVRAVLQGLENSDYFDINYTASSKKEAEQRIKNGDAQFVVTFPNQWTKRLIRGEKPDLLVEADATDPVVTGRPMNVLDRIAQQSLKPLLKDGSVSDLQTIDPAFNVIRHIQYNPENITQFNTIPGLVGLILTMTLVLMTSMAITRERERGTMERLLVTPLRPLEVILGKIAPYIVIGYLQAFLIVIISSILFATPFQGGLLLLFFSLLPFMAANLAVGLMFSSLAQNQLQAMQMTFFFFLPSVLLSGFVFPFKGMPVWAQWLGDILPLTHFNRVIRGIILKGSTLPEVAPHLGWITLFVFATVALGVLRYRSTLD